MEGSLSEGTQQNYWEKFSVSMFLSLKPRSPAPPSRPAEDPLLADDTGGILGEPCGVSDLIVLLQAQGLGDCWCCGGPAHGLVRSPAVQVPPLLRGSQTPRPRAWASATALQSSSTVPGSETLWPGAREREGFMAAGRRREGARSRGPSPSWVCPGAGLPGEGPPLASECTCCPGLQPRGCVCALIRGPTAIWMPRGPWDPGGAPFSHSGDCQTLSPGVYSVRFCKNKSSCQI